MAGTTHRSGGERGHGPRAPRRPRQMPRSEPRVILTGTYGAPSWPKAQPTISLPRAVPERWRKTKSGDYLKAWGSRPERKIRRVKPEAA